MCGWLRIRIGFGLLVRSWRRRLCRGNFDDSDGPGATIQFWAVRLRFMIRCLTRTGKPVGVDVVYLVVGKLTGLLAESRGGGRFGGFGGRWVTGFSGGAGGTSSLGCWGDWSDSVFGFGASVFGRTPLWEAGTRCCDFGERDALLWGTSEGFVGAGKMTFGSVGSICGSVATMGASGTTVW